MCRGRVKMTRLRYFARFTYNAYYNIGSTQKVLYLIWATSMSLTWARIYSSLFSYFNGTNS